MTTIASQCMFCKHFQPDWTCAAFPKGIPETVVMNEADHRKPIDGDHGVQFEPIKGQKHPLDR